MLPTPEGRKPRETVDLTFDSEFENSTTPSASRTRCDSPEWPEIDFEDASSRPTSPEPAPEHETESEPEPARAPEPGAHAPAQSVALSQEQQKVLDAVLAGESLFFTGSAGTFKSRQCIGRRLIFSLTGTGKSVLLREIIARLRGANKRVAVTASTGIAGINVGGTTLHSFVGMYCVSNGLIHYSRVLRRRWTRERNKRNSREEGQEECKSQGVLEADRRTANRRRYYAETT